jgi:hypothetical protein
MIYNSYNFASLYFMFGLRFNWRIKKIMELLFSSYTLLCNDMLWKEFAIFFVKFVYCLCQISDEKHDILKSYKQIRFQIDCRIKI